MINILTCDSRTWTSALFGVVQVNPGLNIIACGPTGAFLGCLEVGASAVAPAAFGEKCIPDFDLSLARPPAVGKTPFQNFLVRSPLQRPTDQLIVIDSQEPRATSVEQG